MTDKPYVMRDEDYIEPLNKDELIKVLEHWGATKDPEVENVWWFQGHCILMKEVNGNWVLEEL